MHTPVLLYKSGVKRGIHYMDMFCDEMKGNIRVTCPRNVYIVKLGVNWRP